MNVETVNSSYIFDTQSVKGCQSPLSAAIKGNCLQFVNDIFEKSAGNKIVGKVKIKDLADNVHQGVIIRKNSEETGNFSDSEIYTLNINGTEKGRITLFENNKHGYLVVNALNANDFGEGDYKGIGTELLKIAAQRSMDKGFGGKLALVATGEKSPVAFYYKNNFKLIPSHDDKEDAKTLAIIDYAVRNNVSPDNVLNFPNSVSMMLDKEGAQALLCGERLYEKSVPVYAGAPSFTGRLQSDCKISDEINLSVAKSLPKVRCNYVKNIPLKDVNGKNIDGFIFQNKKHPEWYYACVAQDKEFKKLCEMSVFDRENHIFVNSLNGQNNDGIYKGAGTGLIKLAVELSREKGYDGRVELLATGSLPFYYKNNFRVVEKPSEAFQIFAGCSGFSERLSMDALIDYFARGNSDFHKIWPSAWEKPEMKLDKNAADALMSGKRLYEDNKSETMYNANIIYDRAGQKHLVDADVVFCEVPSIDEPGKCVIQLVQKGNKYIQWLASAEIDMVNDEKGCKFINIDKINFDDRLITSKGADAEKAIKEELLKAVKIKAEELGVNVNAE